MYLRSARQSKGRAYFPSVQRIASCAAALLLSLGLASPSEAQQPHGPRVLPPGPMLDGGRVSLSTPELRVELLRYSGTVALLTPNSEPSLDYTPGDLLKQRSADTFYHLGDLDVR